MDTSANTKNIPTVAGSKPVITMEDGVALLAHDSLINPLIGVGSGFGIVVTVLADQTCEMRCFSFKCSSFGFSARVPIGELPVSLTKLATYLSRAKNYRAKLRVDAGVTRLIIGNYTRGSGFTKVKLTVDLAPASASTCALASLDYLHGERRRKMIRKRRNAVRGMGSADPRMLAALFAAMGSK